MTFDWIEFLNFAKWLTDIDELDVSEEAVHRSAISRAYYAAHHKAKYYIQDKEPRYSISSTGKAHEDVINFFSDNRNPKKFQIANMLRRLKHNRRDADYMETLGNYRSTSAESIRNAEKVISGLQYLR